MQRRFLLAGTALAGTARWLAEEHSALHLTEVITGPLGFAVAETGVTHCAPTRSAASMKAAIAVRMPALAWKAAVS